VVVTWEFENDRTADDNEFECTGRRFLSEGGPGFWSSVPMWVLAELECALWDRWTVALAVEQVQMCVN
jgi:hypothetical protein